MAKEIPQMIRGMGMSVRLLTLLIDEIKRQGGTEEVLHFLTVERGHKYLVEVAKFIASFDWKIPKSDLMARARDLSIEGGYEIEIVESDEKFYWGPILQDLGVPLITFLSDDPEANWPVPDKLKSQLHGKHLDVGMTVIWEGEPHILVSFAHKNCRATEGMVIDIKNLDFLHLCPAYYIDLEK